MAWKAVKGKCLLCGRVRSKGKSILRERKYASGLRVLECTACKTVWEAQEREDLIRQMA